MGIPWCGRKEEGTVVENLMCNEKKINRIENVVSCFNRSRGFGDGGTGTMFCETQGQVDWLERFLEVYQHGDHELQLDHVCACSREDDDFSI